MRPPAFYVVRDYLYPWLIGAWFAFYIDVRLYRLGPLPDLPGRFSYWRRTIIESASVVIARAVGTSLRLPVSVIHGLVDISNYAARR